MMKPRAVDCNGEHVCLVDMTGRVQIYTEQGEYVRSWKMPETRSGRPTGLSFDDDGNLMICDTHYYRILFYTPDGKKISEKTIGGTHGRDGGQFGLVTDALRDSKRNLYVAEYGDNDRIQKFNPEGEFISQWGGHGKTDELFLRPQNMCIEDDKIWIADACNHRVKVYDVSSDEPKLEKIWGEAGHENGQLKYPYDIHIHDDHVYLCEYGSHRIQKMTKEGEHVASWGTYGLREPGQLRQPWAMARDSKGYLQVLDSSNHRVQVVDF